MKAWSRHGRRLRALGALALMAFAVAALVSPGATPAADPPGCAGVDPLSNAAATCGLDYEPVATLDPEWSESFVPPPEQPKSRLRTFASCTPVNVVIYAQTDWLRIAQLLRANPSACANYYISIPPFVDRTRFRAGEAAKIRALGPQMHAMADINMAGDTNWADWIAAEPGRTWFDAGVEARKRMQAAGFDVTSGDTWAVNEFSSSVRTGVGPSRQNMRDLVRGLYTGDGPPVTGLVWVSGIGQPTTNLTVYKPNVEKWLGDAAFWADMRSYVRFFSQEVYAAVMNWAVPETTPQQRVGPLGDYLEHFANTAARAPADRADAGAYFVQANAPLGNAAWPRPAYAWPDPYHPIDYTVAQAFVTAQVYAFRREQASRPQQAWGFAWAPINVNSGINPPAPPIPDFAAKTAAIGSSLAAAIRATETGSGEPGVAACGADLSLCLADLPGAAFNLGWYVFRTWTPSAVDGSATTAEDTPAEITLTGWNPDPGETLSYEVVTQPLHGTVTTTSAGIATYTPQPNFNGDDTFTFRVSDGILPSPPATVTVHVTPVNDAPIVSIDPAGPVDEAAAPIALTAHASDVEGDAFTLSWSTDYGIVTAAGEFSADDGPHTATVTVTATDANGAFSKTSTPVEVRNVPPTADAGADAVGIWGLPVALSGSGADVSAADAKRLTATWDFGDGTTGTGFAPSHAYADPGTYVATLTVHDKDGGAGTDTTVVTVGARDAALAYATAAGVNADSPVVAARISDATAPASARLAGHSVTFELGTSSCSANTDVEGVATCTLGGAPVALGPATLSMRFDGDALYGAAAATAPIVGYGMPSGAAFAVGDLSAVGLVTFWSPSWWLANRLSGGLAPASFKGYVVLSATGWTASPGFDHAPASVPEWMGVVVTTKVTKDAAQILGDTAGIVVVHVATYDSALLGTGTVVAGATL